MKRNTIPLIALALFLGCAAIALSGCGRSGAAVENQVPANIRGEPIASGKSSIVSVTAASVAPAPAAQVPMKTEPGLLAENSDYAAIGFDKLASYHFETDDAPYTNANASADKANQQIPDTIKALSEKKISIKGFMLPLKISDGVVTEFLIMKDQSMCCFGAVPKINEWVSVKIAGAGVKPIMDQPVSMLGTLHVGALRENGYLVGIYQMDGDHLAGADN